MKNIIFLALAFLVSTAFGSEAVVIVLEAPLLKEPKLKSKVLQTLRKGSRVFVPNELINQEALPEFIQTYDRVGNVAYIPTEYIKISTNDLRESDMPITYPKKDPTDYRLEEPIPKTYPFDDASFLRASLALTSGSNLKSPYDYNSTFATQNFTAESGARLNITRKIKFDHYDRYYFGLYGAISTCNNTTSFQNSNVGKENRSVLRLGPVITYDLFKNRKYRLTLGSGFTYNYHKSSLKISAPSGESEERLFSGFSLSPFANSFVQIVDVLPLTDFIMGSDLTLYLPHHQNAITSTTIPNLWGTNPSNEIASGLKAQASFFFGVQVKY
jgi:hypothetical protein